MKKQIAILGSTGSIGTSTLKVIDHFPNEMEVALLSANTSITTLLDQVRKYRPKTVAVGNPAKATEITRTLRQEGLTTQVASGPEELVPALKECGASLTVSAMVGAAGLRPTLAALESGSDVALANKESMVVAGRFMNDTAHRHGRTILPVDSEHNAVHQCLRGEKDREIKRIILTASGGPFRTYEGSFADITPEQALKHPTWDMGRKISIDSATMMNKGLEVIEAHYLFGFSANQIDIVVHPQSIVHSMIETVDGSYLCQLGKTDMVHPIQYALTYPQRRPDPFQGFDITQGATLSFFPPDKQRFPCIQLAYQALAQAGTAPAILNAANEMAVEAFLDRRIGFTQIPQLIETCLQRIPSATPSSLDQLLAIDEETRHLARQLMRQGVLREQPA